jgi:hypothetical protein
MPDSRGTQEGEQESLTCASNAVNDFLLRSSWSAALATQGGNDQNENCDQPQFCAQGNPSSFHGTSGSCYKRISVGIRKKPFHCREHRE